MRRLTLVSLSVSLVFTAHSALAQNKGKGGKKDEAPSASASWSDPAESEQSDKGPYAPQSEAEDGAKPDPGARPPGKNAPDRGRTRDKLRLFGQIVIGFGKMPLNNSRYLPSEKGTAIGLQVGGLYDITPALSAGLRVPVTTGTVRQLSSGQNLAVTAFGSPELMGEYRLELSRLTSVPIGFGVGIPIAQGNPDPTDPGDTGGRNKALLNGIADATLGWRDGELFQPKRLPIIVGGGVRHERRDFELHADAKFVLLPALSSDVNAPNVEGTDVGVHEANGFALREVTVLGGTYNFLDSPVFWGGLDFSVVYNPIQPYDFEPVVETNKPSTLQAVLEPRVGVRFKHFEPSLGYVAPLGGRLGDAGVGGVRLHLHVYL